MFGRNWLRASDFTVINGSCLVFNYPKMQIIISLFFYVLFLEIVGFIDQVFSNSR